MTKDPPVDKLSAMPIMKGASSALHTGMLGGAVIVGIPVLFILVSAAYRSIGWRTVYSEQKTYRNGQWSFGYAIKRPWGWSDNFLLAFSGYGFSLQLESPGTSLKRIQDRRWSCEGRVVYLSIETTNDHGSYSTDETVKIVFDFERSALYTFNGPWRGDSPDDHKKRATTEADFANLFRRLVVECGPADSVR